MTCKIFKYYKTRWYAQEALPRRLGDDWLWTFLWVFLGFFFGLSLLILGFLFLYFCLSFDVCLYFCLFGLFVCLLMWEFFIHYLMYKKVWKMTREIENDHISWRKWRDILVCGHWLVQWVYDVLFWHFRS